MRRIRRIEIGLTVCSLFLGGAGIMGGELTLPWNTVDSGGAMVSTGGDLELWGSVGQPDAGGPLAGGGLQLTGGFWFPIAPGDGNWDGGVNLLDYDAFAPCLQGPGGALPDPQCACFDLDGDKDVDLLDVAEFATAFTGGGY